MSCFLQQFQNWIVSGKSLDQLAREFGVGKRALKMAYTCTYLLQRYHTFGVQYSLAATKRFLGLISKLLASYI